MKITKADLDKDNFYAASVDLSIEGNLEIDEALGWVRFRGYLSASGFILAKAGSGIKAGDGIEAGDGIKAGWGIEAGDGIEAGWGIEAGSGIKAGDGITAQFVFSFQFNVSAKWIQTLQLPFWCNFWAEMSPLVEFRDIILNESNCWDDMRKAVTKEQAEKICAWEGWHPLLKCQLEMFFQLKTRHTFKT